MFRSCPAAEATGTVTGEPAKVSRGRVLVRKGSYRWGSSTLGPVPSGPELTALVLFLYKPHVTDGVPRIEERRL